MDSVSSSFVSPYLRRAPRGLSRVCRDLGRDHDGKNCPDCSVRDLCSRRQRYDQIAELDPPCNC